VKTLTAGFAIGGAYMACCALPLAAGASVLAAGSAFAVAASGIALVAIAGAAVWAGVRRRQAATNSRRTLRRPQQQLERGRDNP
jgi:membrane protein implicated in regulation of membrane protease activity